MWRRAGLAGVACGIEWGAADQMLARRHDIDHDLALRLLADAEDGSLAGFAEMRETRNE